MWKDLYDQGLLFVHQLFTQGHFKEFEQVKEEFGLTQLRYNSLKTAIPEQWKAELCELTKTCYLPSPPHTYDRCIGDQRGSLSQKVYKALQDDVMLLHSKYLKWRQDLGPEFNCGLVEFGSHHLRLYTITNVPKFRSFQYRLLQRAIITNVQLHAWGITDSPNCYYCNQQEETLMHLLYRCPTVKLFWEKILEQIVSTYVQSQFEINFTETNVIFNNIVSKRNHIGNFICLLGKQYIYRQRCLKNSLDHVAFKNYINQIQCIEKFIAISNNKVNQHSKKWQKGQSNMDLSIQQYCENYVTNIME